MSAAVHAAFNSDLRCQLSITKFWLPPTQIDDEAAVHAAHSSDRRCQLPTTKIFGRYKQSLMIELQFTQQSTATDDVSCRAHKILAATETTR